jgi:hypothetical protein
MPPHILAYLDLASGSMIIQGIIAGIVVVPVLMRNKIRGLLGRNKPTDDVLPPETDGSSVDAASPTPGTTAASSDRT